MRITADPGDLGHLLPADDWATVVAAAKLEEARILAGEEPAEAPQVRGYATGLLPLSGVVTARSHGGRRGAPTFGVLHSAETPLRAGYAASLARYARDRAPTSWHYMTDPAETWGVLPDDLVAYHVGAANPKSLGLEQAGRAAMTRAQWLAPEGMAQLRRNAVVMRAARDRYGIGLYWMTDRQLRDAHAGRIVGGWSWHDHCRRVIGGTSHTDPGTGFPFDVQMQLALDGDLEGYDDVAVEQKLDKVLAWLEWWGTPDDDPATPGDERQPNSKGELAKRVRGAHVDTAATRAMVAQVLAIVTKGADVDEVGLARELAPALSPVLAAAIVADLGDTTNLSSEQLVAAVERGVANVLGRAVAG